MSQSPAQNRIHLAALQLFARKGSTRVTVSELAEAAGIARGTIYNNIGSIKSLFESVAGELAQEMRQRMFASLVDVRDPALRLAHGMRFCIRRSHEEPDWGRFVVRFSLGNLDLRRTWEEVPACDMLAGIRHGRFDCTEPRLPGVLAMFAGTTLASMHQVLEGHRTWREAGSDAAALMLRAIGVPLDEAGQVAGAELPPLPEMAAVTGRRATGAP